MRLRFCDAPTDLPSDPARAVASGYGAELGSRLSGLPGPARSGQGAPSDGRTGKVLVGTFPRGTYFVQTGVDGTVYLYRYDDPSMDLGNVSDGTRAGMAAASEARSTADRLAAINRKNAEFWSKPR